MELLSIRREALAPSTCPRSLTWEKPASRALSPPGRPIMVRVQLMPSLFKSSTARAMGGILFLIMPPPTDSMFIPPPLASAGALSGLFSAPLSGPRSAPLLTLSTPFVRQPILSSCSGYFSTSHAAKDGETARMTSLPSSTFLSTRFMDSSGSPFMAFSCSTQPCIQKKTLFLKNRARAMACRFCFECPESSTTPQDGMRRISSRSLAAFPRLFCLMVSQGSPPRRDAVALAGPVPVT